MQHPTYSVLAFLICFVVSCGLPDKKPINPPVKQLTKETGKLIPIDFSDTVYSSLIPNAKDTITSNGWLIQYLVKDDSTRYNDVYLKCQKGNIQGVFLIADMLQLRSYFLPMFETETDSQIYFRHGCATDCAAILVFNKVSKAEFTDYEEIVRSNIPLGQILYVTDTTYQNATDIYELALVDVAKHKTRKLTFHGICDGVYKPACVDTVLFSKNKVSVTVSLRNSFEDDKPTKQTKTVRW